MVQNKTAWKHGAARAAKAIFAVLGALTIVFFAFFGGEFSTLKTLNRVEDDANLFTMEYKAYYALYRFLKIGASTDTELIEFIVRQVLKGIPLKFDSPTLGCSTFAAKLEDDLQHQHSRAAAHRGRLCGGADGKRRASGVGDHHGSGAGMPAVCRILRCFLSHYAIYFPDWRIPWIEPIAFATALSYS